MKSKRVQDVENLAVKHGINPNRGELAAGCPGIMNPIEIASINASWGNLWSGVNADKTVDLLAADAVAHTD